MSLSRLVPMQPVKNMPASVAFSKELTPAEEARIGALVKKAAS